MRALVLGAKSAIAQAIVERLDGYDFALAARDSEELAPFAADLQLKRSCAVELIEFDALDTDALERFPHKVHDQCGPFDLVVLAFGYLGDQQTAERDADEMATTLNANFTGAVIALSHLANYLEARQQPGGIIGIASVAGDRGRQKNYLYGAAKGGLKQLTKFLAHDLAGRGIRVNAIGPGYFHTDMVALSWNDPERRAQRAASTMLGRWGEPEDLAGIAVLLASDAAGYITGQDFYVDGGWLAKL